jgi:hypothetical protein
VFVCHSSEDKTIADAVVATLEGAGVRCWIAPRDVIPGDSYVEDIVAAIEGSRLIVFVFSSSSNESPHVTRELGRAVNAGISILPFRIEDITPSPTLEFYISGAHWLDAMTPPLKEHLSHLASTTRLLLGFDADLPDTPPVGPGAAVAGAPSAGTGAGDRLPWIVAAGVVVALIVVVAVIVLLTRGDDGPGDTPTPTVASTVAPTASTIDTGLPAPDAAASIPEFGSDPTFDGLAERCEAGDLGACDSLYLRSDVDSGYEAYGDSCGGRNTPGAYCEEIYGAG